MNKESKNILSSEIRKLRYKAKQKRNEADNIDRKADDMEEDLNKSQE